LRNGKCQTADESKKFHETLAAKMASASLIRIVRLMTRPIRQPGRAAIASLLTGLVLLLNAMAVSPSLHAWFHSDAADSGHQCAVTLFAHGQVDAASGDVSVVAPLPYVETTSSLALSVFSPAIDDLPAGRAPPVASSNS
jgi:hypothetical protein